MNNTDSIIDVIIPAYNEEKSIGYVINDIPKSIVRHIIVCNNNSSDNTASVASSKGAVVVQEAQPGYGQACLKGIAYIKSLDVKPDIVVFLDGDYSDHPEEMEKLLDPIIKANKDMVIGSRAIGLKDKGAMMPQQIFGNWLATTLIKYIYNYRFTDLGPFRAIKWQKLIELNMQDTNFGWTVEMQVKAAKHKFNCAEVAVKYRKRIGISKVSGTIKGTVMAGYKILYTIFKLI
jgi:glycosyltransferase involved in cell wall biosynthesis